ncbi:hypothetical protein B0H17DRAFT_274436 [Mycena rosella]|uniref:Nuclear GTPase SLIP-GC n=1 Tax=Mycena rosella TaxID=1033263 RepID=A0AAD7DX45_MYCRO|nr:hypothetical protein B0H17DRAFT_274436 [Mycena rosella]
MSRQALKAPKPKRCDWTRKLMVTSVTLAPRKQNKTTPLSSFQRGRFSARKDALFSGMTHYKENTIMGSNSSHTVKMEPTEFRMAPAVLNPSNNTNVKAEPSELTVPCKAPSKDDAIDNQRADIDVPMQDAPAAAPASSPAYEVYTSPTEIAYTPEYALQQGLKMINKMASSIQGLQLGPRRQEVWLRETASLRSQGAPSTLIAVCGATGSGKSSILNAILDDNIVPTSGMRACTAVVTEIAYHKKKTIDADVSFLSEAEWKAELKILLDDLVDDDGNLKRSTDMRSDAGVAWSKVHAVYPTILQEKLVTMTPEQIIAKDPKIAKILGATKNIVAKDSKVFASEIAKYIDSVDDRKRGKDKKKDKSDKSKDKSLMDKVKEAAGKSKSKKNDAKTPALWPLIRQVNVRCPSAALATGAVLVDLPGTGDANAARNSIAKTYLKKCDCIWILAPITRAVDDKIAKDLLGDAFRTQLMMDGNYDDSAITFIASKCDDIACSEVIRALNLDDDPELEEIQERIDQLADETTETKKNKAATDRSLKSLETELKRHRAFKSEYEEHLQALKDGQPFVPRLTATKSSKPAATKNKKRKNTRGGKRGSPKRRRSSPFDSDEKEDDEMDDEDDDDESRSSHSDSNSDSESENDSDAEEKNSDSGDEQESSDRDSDVESVHDEAEEEVTEETVELKITEMKALISSTLQRRADARKEKKAANDYLDTLKKKVTSAQKEKNAFCSLKRSEFSKEELKKDFRAGLKDLDEAAAEERDPANFDPGVALRDYDAIDLPVFTCSSRDYVRLKKQVKGDGEPTCFSNVQDTGIPDLQKWCHSLTKSSRERAARNFLAQLATFATSVKQYVAGIGNVTAADRESLRSRWESGEQEVDPGPELDEEDPFAAILGGGRGLYTINQSAPKVDRYGNAIGITPRLVTAFGKVVEASVSLLKDHLRDGLEERCRVGAVNAAEVAVATSDDFANTMHWASYRATLRRNGEYRRDLNVELVNPFTRNIAQKWQQVFEADIFASLLSSTVGCINEVVSDVETSAAPGLRDRARLQGESCLNEARVALDKTVETVKETLNNEQKEVSRSLAPHVQGQLLDGYEAAMEERGKGSVARQKASFRSYISDCKDDIFEDSVDVIMARLTDAAEAIGKTLNVAMDELAQKVEVNLAVLWEGVQDDPTQAKARSEVVTEVDRVLQQLQFIAAAEKARHAYEDQVMT